MAKRILLSRINPNTGRVERPWQDADGNYVLADPGAGGRRHHRSNVVITPDYEEAVRLVREHGHSIRMKAYGTQSLLISPSSIIWEEVDTCSSSLALLARQAPVSRKALHHDLARTIVAQAAAIMSWSGGTVASMAFLGFHHGEDLARHPEDYFDQVDLDRFPAKAVFDCAYDWAHQVGEPQRFSAETWSELEELVDSASAGWRNTRSPLASARSVIRRTADAAYGRWLLVKGLALSTRQLALLANMEEAGARNALSKAGISTKAGVPTDVALLWLLERRGFVPTEG